MVGAHLMAAAWRPALLLNVPVGAVPLLVARGGTPPGIPAQHIRLDLLGVALLSAALLALVVPLRFGRDAGWPSWAWTCLATSAVTLFAFVLREQRTGARGGDPLRWRVARSVF